MAVINTNVKALFSQMALGSSGRAQTVAMQQLSTGKRINSARDDAAGMAIATRMTHQIRSLNQAVRNAGDAINLIQTAEGATNEITDMMQRMRELAIQAVNDTNDNAQRSYLDLEFQQLKQQMVQIAEQTQWNGFPVLTGEAGERVGEMPVFKAISNSQFGDVFVSPTTKREITGVAAGQTQVFKFSGTAADGDYAIQVGNSPAVNVNVSGAANMGELLQQLKTGIASKIDAEDVSVEKAPQISKVELPSGTLTAGTVKVAGVTVTITADDIASPQNYGNKIKKTLEENGFTATAGRNVAVDPDTGALTITFDKNETPASVTTLLGSTNTGATFSVSDVQTAGYQLSITFNKSAVDAATGLAPDVTITEPAGSATVIASPTAEFKTAMGSVDESWSSVDGAFIQSGAVSMNLTATGEVNAEFVDSRNNKIPLVGVLHPSTGEVTFSVDQGRNREVMTRDLTYKFNSTDGTTSNMFLGTRPFKVSVDVRGGIPAMAEGDMVINDVPIGQSYAKDDTLSPPGNAAGSAIAKAAAINRKAVMSGVTTGETQTLTLTGSPLAADLPRDISVAGVTVRLSSNDTTTSAVASAIATQLQASSLFAANTGRVVSYQPGSTMVTVKFSENEGDVANMAVDKLPTGIAPLVQTTVQHLTSTEGTGVFAKVNENVFTGQAMTGSAVVHGVVMVNGFASAQIDSVFNNPRETRANTVRAINMISDKTGVRAVDTGSDTQGITLVATDGRNIELHFETNDKEFGQRIGMREGVQAATISLESKIQAPVIITSRGDVSNSGFLAGNYTKNESVFNTAPRAAVTAAASQVESLKIGSTVAVGAYSVTVNGTQFSVDATATMTAAEIRTSLVQKINEKSAALGVTASAGDSVSDLRLTANVPGNPFTQSAAFPTGGVIETTHVVPNSPAAFKPLTTNDLMINGVKIRPTVPADDLLSSDITTSSDKASSAIALANAINSQANDTGVHALANPAVSAGSLVTTANSPAKAGQYSLFVNGVEISVYLDPVKDSAQDRVKNVANAINQRTGTHGVTATVNDKGALTLSSDGRNLSAWFDSSVPGLSAASFGLDKAGDKAAKQESTITAAGVLKSGEKATVKFNGETITVEGDGTKSTAELFSARFAQLQSSGEITNMDIKLNTAKDTITFTSQIAGSGFTLTGATAGVKASGAQVDVDIAQVAANDVGGNDVIGIYKATATSTTAKTLYGTVRLTSDPALLPQGLASPAGAPPSDQMDKLKATGKPFTVTAGIDGFSTDSNFSALGFQVGQYGGQSSAAMDPPRVGRMAFQVGAGASQMITIDLADFGKNGAITSEITGDVDLNVDSRSARINTRENATSVLTKLDVVMDRVNATRATMGAVMNRLDHVINNLTNVSMNLSASRSAIEDADYAAASTELAKTQIMQQAATAVLAQANTSQQSVLKLLGG